MVGAAMVVGGGDGCRRCRQCRWCSARLVGFQLPDVGAL